MNKVAAFALRRKNSILSMSEKLFCPPQPLRLVWITPAYAGKRQARPGQVGRLLDHPRVCGEKTFAVWENVPGAGSPPRVRGKAWAWGRCCPDRLRWDHPRVCGEKPAMMVCSLEYWGSPPRMRGKVSTDGLYPTFARITPAYAGKSDDTPSNRGG